MDKILYWYEKNNSNIIQSLMVIIGLLLCYFIYRLFFSAKANQAESAEGSKNIELDSKLDQIIAAQTQIVTKTSALPTADSEEHAVRVEQLQTEIFNLKQTLKEVEGNSPSAVSAAAVSKILSESTGAMAANVNSLNNLNADATGAKASSPAEIEGYLKQIDELKNRLSDYEVISEDIADLQSLREENKKLKEQQLQQQPADLAVSKVESSMTSEDSANTSTVVEVTTEDKDLIQQFEKSKGS